MCPWKSSKSRQNLYLPISIVCILDIITNDFCIMYFMYKIQHKDRRIVFLKNYHMRYVLTTYIRPPLSSSYNDFNLPLSSANTFWCGECCGGVQIQLIIQYFSHYLKIGNGYSRNILHNKTVMELCSSRLDQWNSSITTCGGSN